MADTLRCEDCGELSTPENEVAADNMLCSECESEGYVYCAVCGEWLDRDEDYPCQHLTWVDGAEFVGAGADPWDRNRHRDDVHLLLDIWPAVACDCLRALKSNSFTARCDDCDRWVLKDDEDVIAKLEKRYWLKDTADGANKSFECGIAWVASLDGPKTKKANQLTARWVEEWLAKQKETANG